MEEKYCKKCENSKPTNEFTKHKRSKDGLYYCCKDCKNRDRKEYASHGSRNGRYKEDPLKSKERLMRFIKNNPDYMREYANIWRKKNPDKVKAKKRRETESGIDAHYGQVRRARARNLLRNLSTAQWEDALRYFKNKCAYCRKANVELQKEHFIPLSKGGGYTASNIIPACKECNQSKKDAYFEDWYRKPENRITIARIYAWIRKN